MKDNDIIKRKFEKAKSAEDFYDLAQCYEHVNQFGNPNPYFNNFKRMYWYLKSGNLGFPEAYNNLAFIIEHELEIKIKNRKKRYLEYYKKSYEMGSKLGKENYFLSLKQIEK
jgi:TPR repeat protein